MQAKSGSNGTADAARDDCDHKRALVLEDGAVDGGLGDAGEERRDGGSAGELLELGVLGLEEDGKDRETHGKVGADGNGQDDVIAEHTDVHLDDGDKGPVHTKDDEAGPKQTDEEACGQRGNLKQGNQAVSDETTDEVGDGADDVEGERSGHDEGHDGNDQALEDIGDDLIEALLDPGLRVHGKDDGDNRARVADERYRDAKEVNRVAGAKERGERGVAQRNGDGHGRPVVALELLGRSAGKEDRHEVEHAVADGVKQLVGGGLGREPTKGVGHDHKGLEKAGGGHGGKHRHKDAADELDGAVNDAATGLVLDLAAKLDVGNLGQGVIHVGNVIADNNLVLTGGH